MIATSGHPRGAAFVPGTSACLRRAGIGQRGRRHRPPGAQENREHPDRAAHRRRHDQPRRQAHLRGQRRRRQRRRSSTSRPTRSTAEIPVGQRPWNMALTPDGKKLYVANGRSNSVSVIDTGSAQGRQGHSGRRACHGVSRFRNEATVRRSYGTHRRHLEQLFHFRFTAAPKRVRARPPEGQELHENRRLRFVFGWHADCLPTSHPRARVVHVFCMGADPRGSDADRRRQRASCAPLAAAAERWLVSELNGIFQEILSNENQSSSRMGGRQAPRDRRSRSAEAASRRSARADRRDRRLPHRCVHAVRRRSGRPVPGHPRPRRRRHRARKSAPA